MNNHNLIHQISMAIAAAVLRDLPDIPYRHWTPDLRKQGVLQADAPLAHRRPREADVEVIAFPQTWGSTALGFGGLGGAAITTAQTTVVTLSGPAAAAVYFGTRLAYVVDTPNERFAADLRDRRMAPRAEAEIYGAVRPEDTSA